MKKVITTICLLLCVILSQAQDTHPLKMNSYNGTVPKNNYYEINSFQVEDQVFVEINNAHPGAVYKFNSKIVAGKQLLVKELKTRGVERLVFTREAKPALVLKYMPGKVGNKYNSQVQYFDKQEFAVKNIELKKSGNSVSISWDAVSNADENIKYQIVQTAKNAAEKVVKEFNPSQHESWETITYDLPFKPQDLYSLVIMNNNETRIKQGLSFNIEQERYILYPTLVAQVLNIDFLAGNEWGRYKILNVSGQVLMTGALEQQYNKIDVATLPPGNYITRIELEDRTTQSIQFSKK